MKIFKNYSVKYLFIFSLLLSLSISSSNSKSSEEVFSKIYREKIWGANSNNQGSSGLGSTEGSTVIYREFIQDFLKTFHINSVVDLGCGDWEFSKLIDWSSIKYIGFDVVEPVIENNKKLYQKENINFSYADILTSTLPTADLLICKDVLQHLTNQDIEKILGQLVNYKYCLITNDVNPSTFSSDNPDIERGNYRQLDLTKPPFNLNGLKILNFKSYYVTKQVLLIVNSNL